MYSWSKRRRATAGPADLIEDGGGGGRAAGPAAAAQVEEYRVTGEVTNSPAWTVDGRPASVTVPTWVQCLPSAES